MRLDQQSRLIGYLAIVGPKVECSPEGKADKTVVGQNQIKASARTKRESRPKPALGKMKKDGRIFSLFSIRKGHIRRVSLRTSCSGARRQRKERKAGPLRPQKNKAVATRIIQE